MSYFDDYVADGMCCEQCGAFMDGDEPGFVRVCAGCARPEPKPKRRPARKRKT